MSRLLLVLAAASVPAGAYDAIHFEKPVLSTAMARPVAAAASADRLYVTDEKMSTLLIFGADGTLLKTVGKQGSAAGAFRSPRGVAVGPSGRVYVADTDNNRVQILDQDGKFLYAFGEKGSEPGKLKDPRSVAVGADGRIFVADTGNDRIQVFTEEGILLFRFGSSGKESGQFHSPTRVSVDPGDNVYVVDTGNNRVQKFDSKAHPIKSFPLIGWDAVADASGFLYMLDGSAGKVVEESADGFVLGKFGSRGDGPGQMKKAEGIAIAADGSVLVADTGNARIQRVSLPNKLKPGPIPENAEAKMSVSGPTRSWKISADVLSSLADAVYAYAAPSGPFLVIGPDGKEKLRFGSSGKDDASTRSAGGLAVSATLGVYAADTYRRRLQHFNLDGKWTANLGEAKGLFDSRSKEGRIGMPAGVAVNDAGTIYVADPANHRIDAFNPDGVFLFAIGPRVGQDELKEPVGAAWDKSGFLYFVDKGLGKVFKCEPSGAYVSSWGGKGVGPGEFQEPIAVAFDGFGDVFTLDAALRRVSVHSRDGQWLGDFFGGGGQDRELLAPVSLTVSGNRLVISDKGKGLIVSYDLHPQPAAPTIVSTATKQGTVALSWAASEDPWTSGYRVLRSTRAAGPYVAVGSPVEPKFADSEVVAGESYFYRVAAVARTGESGIPARPALVMVVGASNRAPIEISTVTIGNMFAANYKWYLHHPVGTVSVRNNVNVPFHNVKVTFRLKEFMDFGFDQEIAKLEPGKTVEIPLIATLNNKVLDVTEDTPIQAEFALSYFENGENRVATLTKPLRLYSRNAITWDDPRRIANFITYKDEPIKSFKSAVTVEFRNPRAAPLNPNVIKALKIWNALGETGVRFAANPANPFESAHDNPNFPVDYTQYPRETLKRRTGQCSDLTSLYAALLADSEIRVALLDYPGHMTLMFDTDAEDAAEAGISPDQLVENDGSMWLPIEVTLIGKPFTEAVSKAAYAYKTEAAKGRVRIIDVNRALEEYEPVSMPPATGALPALDAGSLKTRFDEQVGVLARQRREYLKEFYEEKLAAKEADVDARLQLGIVELQAGDAAAAKAEFINILAADPKNSDALNNLGCAAFGAGDFAEARNRFAAAAEADPADSTAWLNLTKTELKLKDSAKARAAGKKAVAAAAELKPAVESLLGGSQ